MLSLQGAGWFASRLTRAYWEGRTALIFSSVNMAHVGRGELEGNSHWGRDDPKIFLKKKM